MQDEEILVSLIGPILELLQTLLAASWKTLVLHKLFRPPAPYAGQRNSRQPYRGHIRVISGLIGLQLENYGPA